MQPVFGGRARTAVALLAATAMLGGCCVYGNNACQSGNIAGFTVSDTGGGTGVGARTPPALIHTPQPGDVLVAGGINASAAALGQVEFYQQSTGTFQTTGPLATPVAAPGAALITFFGGPAVLIAGGASGDAVNHTEKFTGVATAEMYAPVTGRFYAASSAPAAFAFPSSTTLLDGTVLFAGGFGAAEPVRTAAIYNANWVRFSPTTGPMTVPRVSHTATLLPDGTVLIVGGLDDLTGNAMQTAELYDPSSGLFRRTRGALPFTLAGHTATLISCGCRLNGQVLIAGGASTSRYAGTTYDSAHVGTLLYQPTTESFAEGPPLNEPRALHTATILRDGTVLIAGGMTGALGWRTGSVTAYATDTVRDDAEIFDPKTRSFTCVGGNGTALNPCKPSMTSSRLAHTATLLAIGPNAGKVLLAGGEGAPVGSASEFTKPLDTAEVYDPATGTFTATGSMHVPRAMHAALLLP
jgi:hypothetical protein